jgi:hypothetical protein
MTARKWSNANNWTPDERRYFLANQCVAPAGHGTALRCSLSKHGADVPHTADGMQWRDGEPPRGMMGLRSSDGAMLDAMPTAKNTIQVQMSGAAARLVRPGARYAVRRSGEEYRGTWVPDGEALPRGTSETFTEAEARLVLPFLRVRGTAGRRGSEPTTADGKLVARACRRLGLSAVGLAEKIGAHESVLSRARHGELPETHREAIKALLAVKRKASS